MGKLIIPDSLILKLEYEAEQFQEEDFAGDIINVVIKDEVFDAYTRGYLTRHLEYLGESYSDRQMIEEFVWYARRLREVNK
jgi:hypothetical protein